MAQNQPNLQAATIYQQVMSGQRSIESLSPNERASVLMMARLLHSSCSSNSQKCQSVCDAAEQLESAAKDLAHCAANHDFSDDCDMKFRDTRDAHDEYENAVSEAAGDCE